MKSTSRSSQLEGLFETTWRACASPLTPAPVREYDPGVPGRRFRLDFAWPAAKVAVEVQGGEWVGGRHSRGGGYTRDCERHNLLVAEGWTMFYVTSTMLTNNPWRCVTLIEATVRRRAAQRAEAQEPLPEAGTEAAEPARPDGANPARIKAQ